MWTPHGLLAPRKRTHTVMHWLFAVRDYADTHAVAEFQLWLPRPRDFTAAIIATQARAGALALGLPPEEKAAASRYVLAVPAPDLTPASPDLPTRVCRCGRYALFARRPQKSSPRGSGQAAAGWGHPGLKRGFAVGQPDSTRLDRPVISRLRKSPAGFWVPARSPNAAHLHGGQSELRGALPAIWHQ